MIKKKMAACAFLITSFSLTATDILEAPEDLLKSEMISFYMESEPSPFERAKQVALDIINEIQIHGLSLKIIEKNSYGKPDLYLDITYGIDSPYHAEEKILTNYFFDNLCIPGSNKIISDDNLRQELEKIIFERSGIIPGKNQLDISMQILAYIHRKLASYRMKDREFDIALTTDINTKMVYIKQEGKITGVPLFKAFELNLKDGTVNFVSSHPKTYKQSFDVNDKAFYTEAAENAQPMTFMEFRLALNDHLINSMAKRFNLQIRRESPRCNKIIEPIAQEAPRSAIPDRSDETETVDKTYTFVSFIRWFF